MAPSESMAYTGNIRGMKEGDVGSMCYQAARVKKPLIAVSDCKKKDNPVWFDGHNSFIIPGKSKEVPQLRKLINSIQKKIRLHKKNGVFTMKTWQRPTSPFQGQGW